MKSIETLYQDAIVQQLIQTLYDSVNLEEEYFLQWKKHFIDIHGNLNTQKTKVFQPIEKYYTLPCADVEALFQLIFCLETTYVVLLQLIAFQKISKQAGSLEIQELANGAFFSDKGILNYQIEKHYLWYLQTEIVLNVVKKLQVVISKEYTFSSNIDFIKIIHKNLFIKQIRHSMGEYYTPDWLAQYAISQLIGGDEQASRKTFLDPSCGSGTFLFSVLQKFKTTYPPIFQQVYGIDINPISVLAAKTNYILLYAEQFEISTEKPLTIPIFYADTIQSKFTAQTLFQEIEDKEYEKIEIPQVDYIIGNPPWVNWEYLPKKYKNNTKHLWQYYGLYGVKGIEAGFIKEDISVLFTYVVCDKFLKGNGKMVFVLKETLFKSVKQGEGFRRFFIQPSQTPLLPFRVEDLSNFKPFSGAVNRTALLYLEKGKQLNYPIDYIEWQPLNRKKSLSNEFAVEKLPEVFKFISKKAQPSDKQNLKSGWITATSQDLQKMEWVLGNSAYKARTGTFTGGANAIFWIEILEEDQEQEQVLVRNITHRAKNKVKTVEKRLEKKYVFPFLTGSDLGFWTSTYSKYIVCPHTAQSKMYPINQKELAQYPLTTEYFADFKTELLARKGFTSFDKHILVNHYYALQRIGDYTFAPYKVAWRYICKSFMPAVIEYTDDSFLGYKNIIPNEKIIYIGLNNQAEAYFVCGLISSSIYRQTIESYMVGTQITPSLLQRLNIPLYDATNEMHSAISRFCLLGHQEKNVEKYLRKIDAIVEKMHCQLDKDEEEKKHIIQNKKGLRNFHSQDLNAFSNFKPMKINLKSNY